MRFLARNSTPTAFQFKRHNYWREIHDELYNLYGGICAYCASWTPRTFNLQFDNTSIDHFIPKTVSPQMAYDWDNFRICRARLNANKGDSINVVDPFSIGDGWFILDFSTFLIAASSSIPIYISSRVNETITILCLNDNDYVDQRIEIVKNYCLDYLSISDLHEKYPFIAHEVVRQNFDRTYKSEMRAFFSSQ